MIIEGKASGFPATEIVAHNVGEFIDESYKEWAFFWGEDVSTNELANAWERIVNKGFAVVDAVSFHTIA